MCTFKRLARKLAVYLTSLALIAVCLPVNAQAGEDASDEAGPVTAAISMEGSQAVIGVAVSDGRDFTMGLEASDLFVRSDRGFSAYDLGHQELLTAVPGQTIRVVPLEAPLAGTRADLYLNGQVEPLAAKTDVSGSGESYTYWEIPVTEDLSSIHIVNRTGQEGPRRALRAAAKGAAASGNTFYIVQGDPGISAAGQWTKTSDPNFKGSSDPNYFRNKYGAQPEFSASPKWNPSSGSPVYCANWKGGTEGLMNVTDQGSLQDNADTYNQSILADGSGDNQVLSAYWLKCMAYVLSKGFYDKNQQSVSLVWDGDTSTWGYYQAGDTITLTSQDQMWAATQWSVWALEIMGQTGHPESYQADNHTTSAAVSYRIGHVGSTMSDPAAQITLQAAMDFLTGEQPPRDIEEQLIVNNRMAGSYASENIYRPIDADFMRELIGILTDGMDTGGQDYRFTDETDYISADGEWLQFPPPHVIPECVDALCGFLNEQNVHPLIKAAIAQAYLIVTRPFPEGNERLGRILSGMILLRSGYYFFSDVSLSALIARRSYAYYEAAANILREENEGDMTYFVEYYLELLSRAVDERRLRIHNAENELRQAEIEMARTALSPPSHTGPPGNMTAARETEVIAEENEFSDGFHTVSANEPEQSFDESSSLEISLARVKDRLYEMIGGKGEISKKCSKVLLKLFDEGIYSFNSEDFVQRCGVSRNSASVFIGHLRERGLIEYGDQSPGRI